MKRIVLLVLALAIALAVVGCAEDDLDGKSSDMKGDDKDASPEANGVSGGKPKDSESYALDVACIPKKIADSIGENQPDPSQPPPDALPPPDAQPTLSDMVGDPEEDASTTNSDILASLEKDTDAQDTKTKEKIKEARDTGSIPACTEEGNYKGEDPGKGGIKSDNPDTKSKAKQIVDQVKEGFKVKEAQAQTSCQPIAIVQAGTSSSAADLMSLANAVDKQLWEDFSANWWCGYAYYASDTSQVGTGSWPIYMCGGNTCSTSLPTGSWHGWGYWPFYPYTYAPYGQVPDSTGRSSGDINLWSVAASHESLEALANPYIRDKTTGWYTTAVASHISQGDPGLADYLWEVADPVWEPSKGYDRTSYYDGRSWRVSNFVTQSWFIEGHAAPWDMTSSLGGNAHVDGPFEGKCGGYILARVPHGSQNQNQYSWPWKCP